MTMVGQMRVRGGVVIAVVVALVVGALSASGATAQTATPTPTPAPAVTAAAAAGMSDRARVVALWRSGGPVVRAGAAKALLGTDADVQAFLATGQQQAAPVDDRISVNRM